MNVVDRLVSLDVQDGNWLGVVVSDEYLKEDEPMVDLLHFEQQVRVIDRIPQIACRSDSCVRIKNHPRNNQGTLTFNAMARYAMPLTSCTFIEHSKVT